MTWVPCSRRAPRGVRECRSKRERDGDAQRGREAAAPGVNVIMVGLTPAVCGAGGSVARSGPGAPNRSAVGRGCFTSPPRARPTAAVTHAGPVRHVPALRTRTCVDRIGMMGFRVPSAERSGRIVRVRPDHPSGGRRHPTTGPMTAGRLLWRPCGDPSGGLPRVYHGRDDSKVLLAWPRGYCAGVERAVDTVERALRITARPSTCASRSSTTCTSSATSRRKGAVFVEEETEVPEGAVVVLSAHGVAPEVYANAAAGGLSVIDATCPLVTKVHLEARRFAREGHTILLIGHEGHEEVVGTSGRGARAHVLVESPDEARTVQVPDPANAVATSPRPPSRWTRPTRSSPSSASGSRRSQGPPRDDICYATQNRQDAVKDLARAVRRHPGDRLATTPRTPTAWSRWRGRSERPPTSSTTRPRSTPRGSPARTRRRDVRRFGAGVAGRADGRVACRTGLSRRRDRHAGRGVRSLLTARRCASRPAHAGVAQLQELNLSRSSSGSS